MSAITKVFMICVAYEQGVGKGHDGSADHNAYEPGTDEHEAWQHGYEEGLRQKSRLAVLEKVATAADAVSDASRDTWGDVGDETGESWTVDVPYTLIRNLRGTLAELAAVGSTGQGVAGEPSS